MSDSRPTTPVSEPPLLQVSGVTRWGAERLLLDDVSIELRGGERVAICGPTGSGKTLLLRSLAKLDPIDSGELRWQGDAVCGSAVPEFRSRVIYLHQRPALIEGTVEDNLQQPLALYVHRHRRYSRDAIHTLLGQSGRDAGFPEQSTRDLSGGEAQIVALLRAIQLEPVVLLLDEPTAALDDETTRRIEQLVLGWCSRDSARALVWVSHNREQVTRIATRLFSMSCGRLRSDDSRRAPR